jgi:hypothetical protein
MKSEQVKQLLKQKINAITTIGSSITADMREKDFAAFRMELRTIRSFLYMLRLNNNNDELRLPTDTRRLYSIAKTIADSYYLLNQGNNGVAQQDVQGLQMTIDRAKQEWKKYYNRSALEKLDKVLSSINYSKIQPAVLDNFFNSHSRLENSESIVPDEVHHSI